MGESHSAEAFAGKIVAGGAAIQTANKRAVRAAALAAKETTLEVARGDTGGDLRLSRWRSGKGIKVDTGFTVTSTSADRSIAAVKPRPAGVWSLLEHGALPHSIVPGITKKRRRAGRTLREGTSGPVLPTAAVADMRTARGKARVLSFGPGQVAAYAPHPGTKGKRTWSKATEAARPVAVKTWEKTHNAALLAAFR